MPDETPKTAEAPKPLNAEQKRNELQRRINALRNVSHQKVRSVLQDVTAKLDSANSLIGQSVNAHDDAFEMTADMLLEQAEKQLKNVADGIGKFREELSALRKF